MEDGEKEQPAQYDRLWVDANDVKEVASVP